MNKVILLLLLAFNLISLSAMQKMDICEPAQESDYILYVTHSIEPHIISGYDVRVANPKDASTYGKYAWHVEWDLIKSGRRQLEATKDGVYRISYEANISNRLDTNGTIQFYALLNRVKLKNSEISLNLKPLEKKHIKHTLNLRVKKGDILHFKFQPSSDRIILSGQKRYRQDVFLDTGEYQKPWSFKVHIAPYLHCATSGPSLFDLSAEAVAKLVDKGEATMNTLPVEVRERVEQWRKKKK